MSIQRFVTYILHNQESSKEIEKCDGLELFGIAISKEELSWLKDVDHRRWLLDPEIPHRTLQGALTRCPITLICLIAVLKESPADRDQIKNTMSNET